METASYICPFCNDYVTQNLNSLRIHCHKKHKTTSRELYVMLFLNNVEPTCACGCGKVPKFIALQLGFSKYLKGHYSRVTNNWGHNKKANKKSKETRRRLLKSGEIVVWNKGLSKEMDERVANYGRKFSENITEEQRKIRSQNMSKLRLDGTIPTLFGPNSSQWKGGTSSLQQVTRSRLFNAWGYPKLISSGFKCTTCGSTKNLCVHHDKERFADILHKAITELGEHGDDFCKKSLIVDWVINYHVEQDVS